MNDEEPEPNRPVVVVMVVLMVVLGIPILALLTGLLVAAARWAWGLG